MMFSKARGFGQLLRRGAVFLTVGLMLVLLAPATAQALVPFHDSYSFMDTYVDDYVCAAEGFALNVTQTGAISYRLYYNEDGTGKMTIAHLSYTYAISANGHTIYERDKWQEVYLPDGTWRKVGLTVHIQGPGIVQLDAGQIGFNPDGSVAYVHGPHPQFEGQSFCFALLP